MMLYRVLCHLYEGKPIDLGTFDKREKASHAIDEDMAEWRGDDDKMPPNVSHYEIKPVTVK